MNRQKNNILLFRNFIISQRKNGQEMANIDIKSTFNIDSTNELRDMILYSTYTHNEILTAEYDMNNQILLPFHKYVIDLPKKILSKRVVAVLTHGDFRNIYCEEDEAKALLDGSLREWRFAFPDELLIKMNLDLFKDEVEELISECLYKILNYYVDKLKNHRRDYKTIYPIIETTINSIIKFRHLTNNETENINIDFSSIIKLLPWHARLIKKYHQIKAEILFRNLKLA